MTPEEIKSSAEAFTEIPAISAGKRLGVQWCPWMDDWFTSWSPRNSNSNAEGPWDQWIDLAIHILRDSMTAVVRPEAYTIAQQLQPTDLYDGARVALTEAELSTRFGGTQ